MSLRLLQVSLFSMVVCFGVSVVSSGCDGDGKRETCGNGVDDDDNGLVDCADPDCTGKSECGPYDAGYHGPCARCGLGCTKQSDCINESISRDRPLPECVAGRCEAFNTAISLRVEYDTKNTWGGLGLSPQSVLTRFIKKKALDGSAVSCSTVLAATTGCREASALQLENTGRFVLQGWDLYKLTNPMLGQGISLPFVNVGTGGDYLVYSEFWAGPPASNSDAPQGNRLGFGCFEGQSDFSPIVANDNCPSTTSDAGTCRVIRLSMPGPMANGCP